MKSVLISIRPRWCGLIASGKKTVEVRRTKPKIDVPFKCYIYETQGRTETPFVDEEGHHIFEGRGQVIGEFVCDEMLESFLNNNDGWFVEKGCLTQKEIDEYQGDKAILYGWHITDLVVYDKPKELSEFIKICQSDYCHTCDYAVKKNGYLVDCDRSVKRPPQSWCYCEELK